LAAINIAAFNQKNVAPQVVKKLPVDFNGQISRKNKIITGNNKIISGFFC
jgi:hypothetical protein